MENDEYTEEEKTVILEFTMSHESAVKLFNFEWGIPPMEERIDIADANLPGFMGTIRKASSCNIYSYPDGASDIMIFYEVTDLEISRITDIVSIVSQYMMRLHGSSFPVVQIFEDTV